MQALARRRVLAALVAAGVTPLVRAQARFPARPITLLVPFAPGGIADLSARTVTEAMGKALGQPFVIDNKPSAGSIVASSAVAKAAPDGHTLLLMSNSNALSASLFKKLPYDVTRDFAPVGLIGSFDIGLFVAAGSKLQTLADLLREAKAAPGKLTIGTIAIGSTQHLAAELFKTTTGIDVLIVPYKGTPAVLAALRSGEIDLAFEITGPVLGQLGPGALRALAVTGAQRNPALPAVPTVREQGVAGYGVASWNGLAGPAGLPAERVSVLNKALQRALADAAVVQKLRSLGVQPAPGEAAALQTLLATDLVRWGEVIRRAKIEPE